MKSLFGSLVGAVSNRSPVPLVRRNAAPYQPPSAFSATPGDVTLMTTYGDVGTVFAIVSMLARTTASVPWALYRKAKSGLDEDRVQVTSHAALDLLHKPNKFMTLQEMIETGQQHVDLTGEADLVVSLLGKLPYELWPVRPDKIACVPDPYEFIAGYVYMGPDGERIPLAVPEVMQIRMPNPLDPYTGLGPVQSILTDIDSSRYSAEWNKNFFLNSAEPAGIIEVDRRLEDDDWRQMRDRWAEQHKGVANAHRVAIIEAGSKWVDRKITQRDMEFTSLSTLSRDKILEAFGFPKSMLGIVEDVNRASFEGTEYVYGKYLIVPRLDRWKAMFNNELLPRYAGGDQLEFDYDRGAIVPENSDQENASLTAKWGAVAAAVPIGFDAAGMLEALGLPAVDFEKPAPPPAPVIAPPGQKGAEPDGDEAPTDEIVRRVLAEIEAAKRWQAKAHLDDNTCDPCRANDGKLYKNREDAYADYPDGKGYKDCVGAEFGNTCRCTVTKRKGD